MSWRLIDTKNVWLDKVSPGNTINNHWKYKAIKFLFEIQLVSYREREEHYSRVLINLPKKCTENEVREQEILLCYQSHLNMSEHVLSDSKIQRSVLNYIIWYVFPVNFTRMPQRLSYIFSRMFHSHSICVKCKDT